MKLPEITTVEKGPLPMANQFTTETPWDEKRVETLKRMVAFGHSAQKIANAFDDGTTRNAVIGKARRMKLKLRTPQGVRGPGAEKSPAASKPLPQARRLHRRREVPPPPLECPKPALEPPASAIDPFLFSERQGVLIFDLKPHHCRWPICESIGGPLVAYCGNDRAEPFPYCLGHASIAYRPIQPRRN